MKLASDGSGRLTIVDVTEFYSERGGGIRSHLTSRGHFLCQSGHDHTVIAPGPRDEEVLTGPQGSRAGEEGRARVPIKADGDDLLVQIPG